MKAAPFSFRASAYPAVNAHPCAGALPIVEPGGGFGGGKRGLSCSPPGGSGGQGDAAAESRPAESWPAECSARAAGPVTSTAPRVACWPGISVQFTWSGGRAAGAGAGTAAWPVAAGVGEPAGPAAGTAAGPLVNVTERPAAVRMSSPAEEAVTGGTVPAVVRVRPPCAGRGTARRVAPGHTTLVPLGPSDALTVSLVAALTVA